MQCNDFAEAKRLNDRIEPLTGVFYADPFVDMRNRLKEALVLLGRLPRSGAPAGRTTRGDRRPLRAPFHCRLRHCKAPMANNA